MRGILFRGKNSQGEWEYGVPVFTGLNNELAFMKQMHSYDHQVIPETVGQFTGLTDKNGTKIFEGDIVNERPTFNTLGFRGFVQWDDTTATYRLIFPENPNYYASLGSYSRSYTVIGNIHDNPELLKGGADNG